jgi:uncharacterized protein (DUF2141 family)
MKKVLLLFCLLSSVLFIYSENTQLYSLNVKVINNKNTNGTFRLCLFTSNDGFPSNPNNALKIISTKYQNSSISVIFNDLPKGWYAVALLHDENDNGKMDKGIFGIPKEGYGASNNNLKQLSYPKFEDAKIYIDDNMSTIIECKY